MDGSVLNIPCRIMLGRDRGRGLLPIEPCFWDDDLRRKAGDDHAVWREASRGHMVTEEMKQLEALPSAAWYEATLISVITPEKKALLHIHSTSRLMLVGVDFVQYKGDK